MTRTGVFAKAASAAVVAVTAVGGKGEYVTPVEAVEWAVSVNGKGEYVTPVKRVKNPFLFGAFSSSYGTSPVDARGVNALINAKLAAQKSSKSNLRHLQTFDARSNADAGSGCAAACATNECPRIDYNTNPNDNSWCPDAAASDFTTCWFTPGAVDMCHTCNLCDNTNKCHPKAEGSTYEYKITGPGEDMSNLAMGVCSVSGRPPVSQVVSGSNRCSSDCYVEQCRTTHIWDLMFLRGAHNNDHDIANGNTQATLHADVLADDGGGIDVCKVCVDCPPTHPDTGAALTCGLGVADSLYGGGNICWHHEAVQQAAANHPDAKPGCSIDCKHQTCDTVAELQHNIRWAGESDGCDVCKSCPSDYKCNPEVGLYAEGGQCCGKGAKPEECGDSCNCNCASFMDLATNTCCRQGCPMWLTFLVLVGPFLCCCCCLAVVGVVAGMGGGGKKPEDATANATGAAPSEASSPANTNATGGGKSTE
jgi:hypothetical protein